MRSFAIVILLLVTAWSAGISLSCVGNSCMKDVKDNYNQGLSVSLTPGGLGLCHSFWGLSFFVLSIIFLLILK